MKNLPKEIKIGNRTIEVSVEKMDAGLFGFYDPMEMKIALNKDNNPVHMVETFWHELIHAINDFNRMSFEIQNEMATAGDNIQEQAFSLEERLTEDFAVTFLTVITDNNLLNITAK